MDRDPHMAEAAATAPPPPVTTEAFLSDRQHFWGSFTHFLAGSVAAVVIVLVLMAIFLL
jgi:hypothetical protein